MSIKISNLSLAFHPYPKSDQLKGVKRQGTGHTFVSRGVKLNRWLTIKKQVLAELRHRGIISCEVMLEGCLGNRYLTPAHKDKRKNLSYEEMGDIVLACQNCHDKLEAMGARAMRLYIQNLLDKRA